MSDLYRIDAQKAHSLGLVSNLEVLDALGVLVPVERCKHGKIDGHSIVRLDKLEDDWCPGAGVGDDDDE